MKIINRIKQSRNGMVLILVIGTLMVLSIFFVFMIDRVRRESVVTNRVSINERMYQVASAIGRLAVRKLARDFETRGSEVAKEIADGMFSEESPDSFLSTYTEVVNGLDVVKEIIAQFEKEWGQQGILVIEPVTFSVVSNTTSFAPPIGGMTIANNHERKGNFEFSVTITHMGITKTFSIRKEFFIVRLLAAPFHRFTLFSHKGAEIESEDANGVSNSELGIVTSQKPLVCINRRQTDSLNFLESRVVESIPDRDESGSTPSFIKSGWIYLGGRGNETDRKEESDNLILNVLTGFGNGENNFGEGFHFYQNEDSAGWLISNECTRWLENEGSEVKVSFVDYGFHKDLWKTPFGILQLFKPVADHYRAENTEGNINHGSSIHLFGTPELCTPTLVFGKVKRRYLRTFALYFSDIARVYPIRSFYDNTADFLETWTREELRPWYENATNDASPAVIDELINLISIDFIEGRESRSALIPEIRDYEPYMAGLHNICDPLSPDKSWESVMGDNAWSDVISDEIYFKSSDEFLGDTLCVEDFEFNSDKEIDYTGSISGLTIDHSKYLRDRVSYKIPASGGRAGTRLSECDFFMDNFILEDNNGEKLVSLNQIIAFEGDLIIDIPLKIYKGGIILCDEAITITKPIINRYLEEDIDNPEGFGYLTLVAKSININISGSDSEPIPLHGFFIGMNGGEGEVTTNERLHIIGGVTSDNIDSLVEQGCIIEWGFEPDENFKDKGFYGLVLGPRDIEIISES